MSLNKQVAIDPSLFAWPSRNPALLASCCVDCGSRSFPATKGCMSCGSENQRIVELPTEGKLWTWTMQRFMPKSPYNSWETEETFRPYGVGYLDLPGGLKIEGRIQVDDASSLNIGADMKVVFYVHRTEEDGTEIINYAFSPV